ncbi:MAG TPA: hypothetical protein VMF64_08175 [Steroidobacteraceae bacterium]|nr:hypothetical protein [Steroidobacteraceae bacterium]
MSARSRQREAQRQLLLQRSALERDRLADSLHALERHLLPLDRTLTTIRSVRRSPLLLGLLTACAAGAAMLFRGRTRRPTISRFSWLLPLAGPLLNLLELWWQQRRSGTAAHTLSETPDPGHPT